MSRPWTCGPGAGGTRQRPGTSPSWTRPGYQLSEIEQRVVDEGVADQDGGTDDAGDHGEEASPDDSELEADDAA
ncbi:MAG: hypothetical protein M3P85_06410 [Actinomycetota bacterium]|nr:hypothetical protein [Actinomycetota bacterium]